MDLFIETRLEFTKSAGSEVLLPDDPNAWPTEILQELYKQVPYIADFQPEVIMDRVDGEQRFGFGHIEVQNKTELQGSPNGALSQSAGIRSTRIPIVIKEGKLQPFDVLVTADSKMLPLTERRLRQAIFRPQLFDVTSRTPGDQSMISQLYPPYRQNFGFGGGGASMTAGMGKEGAKKEALNMSTLGSYLKTQTNPQGLARASKSLLGRGAQQVAEGGAAAAVGQKKLLAGGIAATRSAAGSMPKAASILAAILPTINRGDYDRFVSEVQEPRVKAAYQVNHVGTSPAIDVLSKYASKESIDFVAHARPNVVQIRCVPEGYALKQASSQMWEPRQFPLNRGELVRLVGDENALTIDKHGSMTMVEEPEISSDQPEADRPAPIKDYGIYRVQTDDGKELVGFCFPNLIDMTGQALPLTLFTNGSQSAVQSDILGVRIASGANIMEGPPQGHGVFYQVLPNGAAQATVPLTLQGKASGPEGGGVLVGESMDGTPVHIMIESGVKALTPSGDGTVIIPDTFRWLPLDASDSVALVEREENVQKAASAHAVGVVHVRGDESGVFSITGVPVEKVASEERSFIDLDSALFLLGGLGVDPGYASLKMGQAVYSKAAIPVEVSRTLETSASVKEAAAREAADLLPFLPALRRNLTKEAAEIPDPAAVDTVLSLNFINPENIITFISYLPELDQAQQKLCEILMASRLGLQDVSTTACERAVRSLEEVIEGLNTVAFNRN